MNKMTTRTNVPSRWDLPVGQSIEINGQPCRVLSKSVRELTKADLVDWPDGHVGDYIIEYEFGAV